MPSARELLEQADALMRRNRACTIDTEIPELTEIVAAISPAPTAMVIALDDVPELVDAVEEIEIVSIVELPEDIDESSAWLHHDSADWSVVGRGEDSVAARLSSSAAPAAESGPPPTETLSPAATETLAAMPAQDPPPLSVEAVAVESSPAPRAEDAADVPPPAAPNPPIADDWARWEALGEEIRMQVLQRIDIFTDTRLRKQLSAQLQPIVDRASIQMVETINAEVGKLLRAYIAEAIEREIDKWRGTAD